MIDLAANTRRFGSDSPGPTVCNVKRTHRRIVIVIEHKNALPDPGRTLRRRKDNHFEVFKFKFELFEAYDYPATVRARERGCGPASLLCARYNTQRSTSRADQNKKQQFTLNTNNTNGRSTPYGITVTEDVR